jgi:hypothetical protein
VNIQWYKRGNFSKSADWLRVWVSNEVFCSDAQEPLEEESIESLSL